MSKIPVGFGVSVHVKVLTQDMFSLHCLYFRMVIIYVGFFKVVNFATDELREVSWSGIPVEFRPKAWKLLSVCCILKHSVTQYVNIVMQT